MPSLSHISVDRLSEQIGTPAAPVVIDVRIDDDFDEDPRLIPASVRQRFQDVGSLLPRLGGAAAVVICHQGKKLSEGAAAILRSLGLRAVSLEGGFCAWRDVAGPLIPADKFPSRNRDGRTVWVTGNGPSIDRIACSWLIRRFVDPQAQFLFVTRCEVMQVAEKFDATPFGVDGVLWGPRGECCTFDLMIEEFALKTEPLSRLADIVRGAGAGRPELAPECAGVAAASLGLSHMFQDDLAQLDAGMALYDVLYRWALLDGRERCVLAAREEGRSAHGGD